MNHVREDKSSVNIASAGGFFHLDNALNRVAKTGGRRELVTSNSLDKREHRSSSFR